MENDPMATRRLVFRYTPFDVLLVLGSVGTFALLVCSLLWFHSLPAWAVAVAFAGLVFCYCWNVQSISHNFIHNPFFTSDWLNRAFSVLETLVMGVPQTIYHHYHLNHHFGDNDAPGPDGTTKDWGSTYRHGKNGQPEAFWSYCLIGFFRFELGPCFRMIGRWGRKHVILVTVESLALAAMWLGMFLVDWRYFVAFYLPSYYLGWVLTYAHTYALHYNAKPGNYYANSVSSYHRLYNWVFFNNGYHQEHHWDPKAHWTRMGEVHHEILPQMIANGTRVIRGPHITVFLEDWLNRKQATRNSDSHTARAA
jgi:fatty acid desaturase